jgi:hypothetical protein
MIVIYHSNLMPGMHVLHAINILTHLLTVPYHREVKLSGVRHWEHCQLMCYFYLLF